MASIKEGSEPLRGFTDDQIEDLIKSNEILDAEEAKWIKEEKEEKERKKHEEKPFIRARKRPLEIIFRSLFFVFIGCFLFSFLSVYSVSPWRFFWYLISTFACILYTPNRKALKELIDAWPNILDFIKTRSK